METGVRVQWVQDNGMGTPIEKMLSLDPGLLSLNLVGPRSLDSNQGDFEYYAGDMNLLFIGNRCAGHAKEGHTSHLHLDIAPVNSISMFCLPFFAWLSYLTCPNFPLLSPVLSRMDLFNLTFAKSLFQNKIRFTDSRGMELDVSLREYNPGAWGCSMAWHILTCQQVVSETRVDRRS